MAPVVGRACMPATCSRGSVATCRCRGGSTCTWMLWMLCTHGCSYVSHVAPHFELSNGVIFFPSMQARSEIHTMH